MKKKELTIAPERVSKMPKEKSTDKYDTLYKLKKIWTSDSCKDLRLGQLLVNSLVYTKYQNNINNGTGFESFLFNISDENLLDAIISFFKHLNPCCGMEVAVFSGETIDEAGWVFVCASCKKEGVFEAEKHWRPQQINRKAYLEIVKENHPKSNTIPPLLKRM